MIYAVNEETKKYVEEIVHGDKVVVEPDIATPKQFRNLQIDRSGDPKHHRFLFAGKYNLLRKGV